MKPTPTELPYFLREEAAWRRIRGGEPHQLARRALRAVPKRCPNRKLAVREIIRSVRERGWRFADALTDALFLFY